MEVLKSKEAVTYSKVRVLTVCKFKAVSVSILKLN